MAARAILLCAAALAVACGRGHAPVSSSAERIVSLGPATTEALFALGAGSSVVGRSRYCDYPPEAGRLPAVGGMEPDVEAILGLRPDLVVGPSGGWSTRLSQTLSARGIATWFPAEIRTLAEVDAQLLALGARIAHVEDARRLVAALDAKEQALESHVDALPHPRALLVVGYAPVVVAGPGSFADDLLRHAGAVNAVADGGPWPTLGFERIAELDPDLVVDAAASEGEGGRIDAQAPGWRGVRAVAVGHVVRVTDARVLRPGPRIAEGLGVLARAVHPGAVP